MTPPHLRLGPVFAGATAVAGAVAAIAAIVDVARAGSDLQRRRRRGARGRVRPQPPRGRAARGAVVLIAALGVPIYVTLARGWAPAVLVGVVGVTAGDLSFRGLGLRAAIGNASYVAIATAAAGLGYAAVGGTAGGIVPRAHEPRAASFLAALLPLVADGLLLAERALHADPRASSTNC